MIIDEDVFLEHHGIRGMKWGQRKATFQKGRQEHQARLEKVRAGTATKQDRSLIRIRRLGAVDYGGLAIVGGIIAVKGAAKLSRSLSSLSTGVGETMVRGLLSNG